MFQPDLEASAAAAVTAMFDTTRPAPGTACRFTMKLRETLVMLLIGSLVIALVHRMLAPGTSSVHQPSSLSQKADCEPSPRPWMDHDRFARPRAFTDPEAEPPQSASPHVARPYAGMLSAVRDANPAADLRGSQQLHECVESLRHSSSSSPSLHSSAIRVGVVTSRLVGPTLAMVRLIQLADQPWCVVVLAEEDTTAPTYERYQRAMEWQLGPRPLPPLPPGAPEVDRLLFEHILAQDELQARLGIPQAASSLATARLRLCYLTVTEQSALPYETARRPSSGSPAARKNIGFALAAHVGADVLFDFDDASVFHHGPEELAAIPYFATAQALPVPTAGELLQANEAHTTRRGAHASDVSFDIPRDGEKPPSLVDRLPPHADEPAPSRQGNDTAFTAWNPFPAFGLEQSWPRGYPLPLVQSSLRAARVSRPAQDRPRDFVGLSAATGRLMCFPVVQQYLANVEPDADALCRRTSPDWENGAGSGDPARHPPADDAEARAMSTGGTYFVPFSFAPSVPSIQLPPSSYAPYNAQSTLHLKAAFFGLVLPPTVHARFTDVWRAYCFETLNTYAQYATPEWDAGGPTTPVPAPAAESAPPIMGTPTAADLRPGCVVFSSSRVARVRPSTQVDSFDFQAEAPLHALTPQLLQFLQERRRGHRHCLEQRAHAAKRPSDMLALLVQLWIDLYEVGVLEREDVEYARAWARDLQTMGTADAEAPASTNAAAASRITSDAASPPSGAPSPRSWSSPLSLVHRVAPPQGRVGVCIVFNSGPSGGELESALMPWVYQHRHLTLHTGAPYGTLAPAHRSLIEAFPHVSCHYVNARRGWYQQYDLYLCAQSFAHLLRNETTDHSRVAYSTRDSLMRVWPREADQIDGIAHHADDMFVNFTQLLLPAPFGRADAFDTRDSWVNSWSTYLEFDLEPGREWNDTAHRCHAQLPTTDWVPLPSGAPLPSLCHFLNMLPQWSTEAAARDPSIRALTAAEVQRFRIPIANFGDLSYLSASDSQVRLFCLLQEWWERTGETPLSMELVLTSFLAIVSQWTTPMRRVSRTRVSELSELPGEWAEMQSPSTHRPTWMHTPIDMSSPAYRAAETIAGPTRHQAHLRAMDTNGYASFRRDWYGPEAAESLAFDARYQFLHTLKLREQVQKAVDAVPGVVPPILVTPTWQMDLNDRMNRAQTNIRQRAWAAHRRQEDGPPAHE